MRSPSSNQRRPWSRFRRRGFGRRKESSAEMVLMFRRSCLSLFAVWLLGQPDAAAQRPPTIAAAANLNFALTEIARQFERDRGTHVDIVFGASGTLTRQIRDGAPFEMFLAA